MDAAIPEYMRRAVAAAFELEDYDTRLEAKLASLAEAPQAWLDHIIEHARHQRQPGLRRTVIDAHLSGDANEIERAYTLAQGQAEIALVLTAARTILRQRQASSQAGARRSRMNLRLFGK